MALQKFHPENPIILMGLTLKLNHYLATRRRSTSAQLVPYLPLHTSHPVVQLVSHINYRDFYINIESIA